MAKYNAKTVERICEMISTDSYRIDEISAAVGITEKTFYEWQATKREFSEAVKRAREKYDKFILVEAEKSLVKLVRGYTVEEKKTVYSRVKNKDGSDEKAKVKEHTVTEKYFQPNTAAVIFALTNRDGEKWKNRQYTEHTGKGGKDLFEAFDPSKQPEAVREALLGIAEKLDLSQ
jgi:hypothetical protein